MLRVKALNPGRTDLHGPQVINCLVDYTGRDARKLYAARSFAAPGGI
jgi:hypothetical protein